MTPLESSQSSWYRDRAVSITRGLTKYIPFSNDITVINIWFKKDRRGAACTRDKQFTVLISRQSGRSRTDGGRTIYLHPGGYSPEGVLAHELGHAVFLLADEYKNGSTAMPGGNCSTSCREWASMIGYKGVGCIPNNCKNGGYSIAEASIMGYPFMQFG
jgi:hypothetical protein